MQQRRAPVTPPKSHPDHPTGARRVGRRLMGPPENRRGLTSAMLVRPAVGLFSIGWLIFSPRIYSAQQMAPVVHRWRRQSGRRRWCHASARPGVQGWQQQHAAHQRHRARPVHVVIVDVLRLRPTPASDGPVEEQGVGGREALRLLAESNHLKVMALVIGCAAAGAAIVHSN